MFLSEISQQLVLISVVFWTFHICTVVELMNITAASGL